MFSGLTCAFYSYNLAGYDAWSNFNTYLLSSLHSSVAFAGVAIFLWHLASTFTVLTRYNARETSEESTTRFLHFSSSIAIITLFHFYFLAVTPAITNHTHLEGLVV